MADVHGGYLRLFRWGGLFYGRPGLLRLARLRPRSGPVVFITGTQGKTTTLRALRHVLGLPVGVWEDSNTNTRGEVPWNLLRLPRDAPALPLEVPDGSPELAVFTDVLRPDAAIILNVGQEHVGLLGSFEAAVAQFADLLAALPPDGFAVVNADDPHLRNLPTEAHRITFGRSEAAQVRVLNSRRDRGRLTVDVRLAGRTHTVRTQLVGMHYAHAVAAVMATAYVIGVPPEETADRLATLTVTPSRLQPFRSIRGATILSDDYKATPETVVSGLIEVSQWPAAARWAVIGELTNLATSGLPREYREVASACERHVDRVVTFGDEWETQATAWDGLDVRVDHMPTVLAAADHVLAGHGPDDVIYVKGTEDVRPRRITVRLRGIPINCSKPECKKAFVLCENCSERWT